MLLQKWFQYLLWEMRKTGEKKEKKKELNFRIAATRTHGAPCIQGRRKVWKSGVPVLFDGHNLPPLVEIGLTDLPKSGGTMAPPAPPGTTPLKDPTNFISQSSMASLFSSKGCDGSNTENGEVLQIVLRFTFLTRSDFLIKFFSKINKSSALFKSSSNRSRKNWELSRQKGLL